MLIIEHHFKIMLKYIYLVSLIAILPTVAFSQTQPTPAALPFAVNFGTLNFTPPFNANMASWTGSGIRPYTTQAAAEASDAGANAAVFNTTPVTSNSGGQYGHAVSNDGRLTILQSGNTTNGTTQLAFAINTTGAGVLNVSYDLGLFVENPRSIGLALQYRSGTTGAFTTINGTSIEYSNTSNNGGDDDGPTDLDNYSFTLPAATANVANLQLRFITWNPGGSGARSGISIDNIQIGNFTPQPPCTEPAAQPTNLILSPTPNSVTGSFTIVPAPTTIQNYLVVRTAGAPLSATPVDGLTYASGATVNGGNGIAITVSDDGNFTDNTVLPNTAYNYYIFSIEDQNCSGGPNYLQVNPLTGSTNTPPIPACVTPFAAPTNLILTPANTNITGTFTASASANSYLTIVSTNSTLSAVPADGTIYTNGQAFGGGTIVSYQTGNTFTVTGLMPATTYYLFVFAANNQCTGEPFYNTTALSGTVQTTNTPNGIPPGYYDAAAGLTCQPMKTALKNIITNGANTLTYTPGLWNLYLYSDMRRNDNNTADIIWDMYSDNPSGPEPYTYTYGVDQCGNISIEGDCYNREHSTPQSFFASAAPMQSDAHHIFPTDGKVNGIRSNFPYGEVTTATTTSLNGSKLGTGTNFGYSNTVFEPIDAYKGDFARAGLYMATRYEDQIINNNWSANGAANEIFLSITDQPDAAVRRLNIYDTWQLQTLLKWHQEDPVSQKEIDRNNAVYSQAVNTGAGTFAQNNRNPFVDHPEYVAAVYQCSGLLPVTLLSFTGQRIETAALLQWQATQETNFKQYEIERSNDGLVFLKIGSVPGQNLTNYHFKDAEAPQSLIYYRLKMIDIDGRFKYSDIVKLEAIPFGSKSVLYPNPAKNQTTLVFMPPLTTATVVRFYDVTGRLMFRQTVAAGKINTTLNLDGLSSGQYFVKWEEAGKMQVQQLSVVQ